MIEKKITYDINIEKPSKTKPVKQGGVLNYLGKQKTVNAPVKWRSSKEHPVAHLAYITKDEEKILIDLNLYGSLKGKPNKGPFGLPSLQGSGGGSGGDGGGGDGGGGDGGDSGGDSGDSGDSGPGDSGPGGSDDGSGHGGPGGPGDSGPGGSDDGTGHGGPGPGSDAAANAASDAANAVSAIGEEAAEAAGIGPSSVSTSVSTSAPASTISGVMSTLGNMARAAMNTYASISPVGIAVNAISNAISNAQRGVTAPNDFSQATESVQSSAPSISDGGGGITTIGQYAPLSNTSTGDNTQDAIRTRLENLLKIPTTQTVFQPQNVNQLSNYTLADLTNLRRI